LEKESPTPIDAEEFVAGVMRDLETSGLGEKEKTLFRFIDRVNHHSPEITPQDMQPLYAAGWDDGEIYYAITVCALFNFYNRWIDASGVHALSDETHRQGGKRSASVGYVRK
jgi:alkylhydroperoxidase family enzyme